MFNISTVRAIQIKKNPTMTYHLSAVRRTIVTSTKDWFWQRQNATLIRYWWKCKLVCGKPYAELHSVSNNLITWWISKENEMDMSKKPLCSPIY